MSFNIEADGTLSIAILFLAHLGLCAAYIQGGLVKLTDFHGAVAEMVHFRLAPPALFAVLVIALELVASAMVMTGLPALARCAGAGRVHPSVHPDRIAVLGTAERRGTGTRPRMRFSNISVWPEASCLSPGWISPGPRHSFCNDSRRSTRQGEQQCPGKT